jgi:hypothetical protein
VIAIDTDVFLIDLVFQRDARYSLNSKFLGSIPIEKCTTIYNFLEVIGQLSFNLSESQLRDLEKSFVTGYDLSILWPAPAGRDSSHFFREEIYENTLRRIRRCRVSFQDALIINLVETASDVDTLVTWNAKHFENKTKLKVITPEQFISSHT